MMVLLKKYKDLPLEVKASLWFLACNFSNKAISMIVVPIYTRMLSTNEYGLYTIFQSWLNIFLIIMTLEIGRGHYALGITKYKDDSDRYTSAMLGLSNTTTLIYFIVYCCAINYFNNILEMNTTLIVSMFVYFLLYPAWEFWCIKKRFEYKYKIMVVGTLLISLLGPSVGVLGIKLLGFRSEGAIQSRIFVQAFAGLLVYVYALKKSHSLFVKEYWKEVIPYSFNLLFYMLSTVVLNQADRIMIKRIIGDSEAAIYSVAYSAAMVPQLFNTAMNYAFVPWLYKKLNLREYNIIEPVSDRILILVGVCNLLLIAFAPELIWILAPPQYKNAVYIIPPLTASVFFMFIFQRFINIEMYFSKTFSISMMSVCVAVLNVILNYFCIHAWGYQAAGYTTLASYVLFCIAHYFVLYRIEKDECNGNIIYHAERLFLFGFTYLILSFSMMLLLNCFILRCFVFISLIFYIYRKRDLFTVLLKKQPTN